MKTAFLEIVELADGRVVLRRAEDEKLLLTLEFSKETKRFLQGQYLDVAKAMLSVGLQMAGDLINGDNAKDAHTLH